MARSSAGSKRTRAGAIHQPQVPSAGIPATASAAAPSRLEQPASPQERVTAFALDEVSEMYGLQRHLFEAQQELEAELQLDEVSRDPMSFAMEGDRIGRDNILGTGIGIRERDGQLTGEIVLKVFVRQKVKDGERIVEGLIAEEYHHVKTDVEEVSEGTAYDQRERPARCGRSVGHFRGPLGTIGCLGIRDNKCVLLSNNHVLALINQAARGDAIVQPGGGRMPQDWIGYLEDFIPLELNGGFNSVDCAIAWVPSEGGYVSPSHQGFTIDPQPVEPRLFMTVKKEGRTTGATVGMIRVVNATRRGIRYGTRIADFRSVIVITSSSPTKPFFGQPGDSGSIIVEAATNRPCALLFGGGGVETFGNPIALVLSALRIERLIDTF